MLIKQLKNRLKLEFNYFRESCRFWWLTRKYNASSCTDKDIEKMQYTLLRENHTIEKGLSLRDPRKGFGQQKVTHLIERLSEYYNLYGAIDPIFLQYPLATIKYYIDYTKKNGVEIPYIESVFKELLLKTNNSDIVGQAGIKTENKKNIIDNCNVDFKSILTSRHSIRYFKKVIPSETVIEEALKMAQLTPSACNRQGWMTHVYVGDKSVELLKWQDGCRGFEEEILCSILVTANLKAFLHYEVHQAYIDGGLYAMNLINALHSCGLGTIPLSTGFSYKKIKRLTTFGIPENEVPIVIIGVGEMLDTFKIAVSTRKDISTTNKWHK